MLSIEQGLGLDLRRSFLSTSLVTDNTKVCRGPMPSEFGRHSPIFAYIVQRVHIQVTLSCFKQITDDMPTSPKLMYLLLLLNTVCISCHH